MTQQLTDILTPLILAIVTALVGVLVYAVNLGKDAAIRWLNAHASASQQAVISDVAKEAHAYAERWFKENGVNKMAAAIEYAAKEMKQRGIDISAEKLQAAIENAWMQYNKFR